MSQFGFIYDVQCFTRTGKLKWREVVHNIVPTEAQNYIISAAVLNGSRYIAWYVGVYNNNYAALPGDTMASFSPNAGEDTNYDELARPLYEPDPIGAGLLINDTTPAVFTFNASRTVRGGFLCSASEKGGTTGLLLSAALFSSPRSVTSGEVLNVKGGIQAYSA
jgi:hypothetical protein